MSVEIHRQNQSILTVARRRRGLTTLEFASCVTAVLGGAWIGALYLGINVQHLAHSALVQAELLDNVPPEWRPQGPVATETRVPTLREELGSLRGEILALRGEVGQESGSATQSNSAAASQSETRAYWLCLNEIALGEDDLQRDAEQSLNDTNAANVFAFKARVSRLAAKDIEAVPSKGVNEEVVEFGRKLASWYARADELYDRAARIWDMPGGQQARTQLTEEWKQEELQHRHEARLLRERAAVVRASVSRELGEEFPEFAKPAAAPLEPIQRVENDAKNT